MLESIVVSAKEENIELLYELPLKYREEKIDAFTQKLLILGFMRTAESKDAVFWKN